MVDVRAAADFKTKGFIDARGLHAVNLNSVAVAVAELAERTLLLNRYFGGIFFEGHGKIFSNLLIYNIFDFFDFCWRHFGRMAEVKTQPLLSDVGTVLYYVVAQHIAQGLVH